MGKSRFRSQPELQRTGRRGVAAVVGAAMAAAFGVGFAFVASRPPPQELATTYLPRAEPVRRSSDPAAKPVQAPASLAKPPAVEVAEIEPAPAPKPRATRPPVRPVPVRAPASAKPPARVQAVRATRPASPVRRVEARAAEPLTPEAEWRRQVDDYDRQVREYRDLERGEGYQWARRNEVDDDGFCRAAGRRSREFMEGCFDYLDGG
jgi:hypothetical protein